MDTVQKPLASNTTNITYCALFAALIAVGAFLRIPIPLVPGTLQFFFTNLAGLILGAKLGAASVAVYIITGLVGIPVFTGGGGIGYILRPTFGYILGFMAGAWVAGMVTQQMKDNKMRYLIASFANFAVVYLCGMIWFYVTSNFYLNSPIDVRTVLVHCFLITAPKDIVICFLSAAIAKRAHSFLGRSFA